jgi:glycosyltransferase involved in cell wall biosynthesis
MLTIFYLFQRIFMNTKKLLVTTSTFPRWQNDTDPPFVHELAKRLTGDFHVTVLAPNYPGALTREEMSGLKVYRFRYFFKKLELLAGSEGILPTLKKNSLFYLLVPFFLLGELWALIKLTRKIKPNVIHAHWILPQGFIAALAKKITGVPYIVTTHGGDIYGMQGKFSTALKRYALHNAAHTTVVSKDILQTIKKKFGEDIPIDVIPMGVDSQLFHPDKNTRAIREKHKIAGPFLLFVGRITEKKGVQYLIEAMPAVLKKFPECRLLLIGSGEQQQKLVRLTKSFELQDRVLFAGAIPNKELPEYFATADIFIGPSIQAGGGDTEGFGLTFVEAAMSGCIVVASDVGGISDIIQDGETGFLVHEKNPHAIADTLCNILKQIDTLADIKTAARQKMISQFDWQVIAEKYKNVLLNN